MNLTDRLEHLNELQFYATKLAMRMRTLRDPLFEAARVWTLGTTTFCCPEAKIQEMSNLLVDGSVYFEWGCDRHGTWGNTLLVPAGALQTLLDRADS